MQAFNVKGNPRLKMNRSIVITAFVLLVSVFSHTAQAQTALVNIMTSESGMHRVSFQNLLDAGVDLQGLLHKRLSLSHEGKPVAIHSSGQVGNNGNDAGNGSANSKSKNKAKFFGPGAFIEFYAELPKDLYNKQRAYTLSYTAKGKTNRLSFGETKARFNHKQPSASSYIQRSVVEEDRYYDFLSPSGTDPWHYGQAFHFGAGDKDATSVDFRLEGLVGTTADINVEVYGIVDLQTEGNDHHLVAKVNGVEVGDKQFDGAVISELALSDVSVTENNTFVMGMRSIAANPFDAMGLNKLTVDYRRNAIAVNDYLEGEFDAGQVLASGFSDNSANVYRKQGDVLTRLTRVHLKNNSAGFSTLNQPGRFIVVGQNGYKKADAIRLIGDETEISSGFAEYLILTHANFKGPELDRLVTLRSQKYQVKVVDVAQVYAQYGYYVPSADAISAYIKHAVANMGTKYVTLIGSDSYDYKNILSNAVSFIPTRYVTTNGGQLQISQTPSDASYGDVDNDGIPDVAVGRITVRTNAELAFVMNKIDAYELRQDYAGRVLIAADKEDHGNGVSFEDDVTAMIDAIPNDWRSAIRNDFKAIPDIDGDQVAHDKIIAAVNAGVSVLEYIGHSSQQQWSRATPPLFRASEIAGLTNIGKPTMVTQWGCWNTYFVDPSGNSMADRFLVGGEQGAVAVLGASTLTTSKGERILGVEMNRRMYIDGVTIGDAVIAAKQALAEQDNDAADILLGWQIIGDPALVVNPE